MAFPDLNATAPGSAITLRIIASRGVRTGFHQIEKLAGRIKVEYRPERDHRVRLLETRFSGVDGGSIAAKYHLRHSIMSTTVALTGYPRWAHVRTASVAASSARVSGSA